MSSPQLFLRELDKKLWTAADRLRPSRERGRLARSYKVTSTGKLVGNAVDIPGRAPQSTSLKSSSAPLGGLCAFAVKKSSMPNFAWGQHRLRNLPRQSAAMPGLAPNGLMALLLSSNSSGEGDIRRALIEADLVECMVALPGQRNSDPQRNNTRQSSPRLSKHAKL